MFEICFEKFFVDEVIWWGLRLVLGKLNFVWFLLNVFLVEMNIDFFLE